jgi:gas vesicle protein
MDNLPPFEAILDDPATDLIYMTAISEAGETMGQTLIQNDDATIDYQQNVRLTAGALLDGINRNQQETNSTDIDAATFIEDVMEEMKEMQKEATYETHEMNNPN